MKRSPAVIAGGLLAIVAVLGAVLFRTDAPTDVTRAQDSRSNPLQDRDGVGSVAFYYGGTERLGSSRPERLRGVLGHPTIVVTTPRSDEAAEVAAIHALGAEAYRYVQFYWAPDNGPYEGIDLRRHPDWAFCVGSPSRATVGRVTDGGLTWRFLDTNEESLRRQVKAVLAGYRQSGWDGVFFDRGQAATQYAADQDGTPIWYGSSTCTDQPHVRGASFADAYVNTLALAHGVGLQVMVNNGSSPFDPVVPMRPDPDVAACREHQWSACTFLGDEWEAVDLVVTETSVRPRLRDWERTFVANRRSERDPEHGGRTVALITTATLGGAANQTKGNVFYQWARLKLFDLAVAINTGNGGCADAGPSEVCNQYGTYPDLTSIRFGTPLTERPRKVGCADSVGPRCVWVRRYVRGAVVLNASGSQRHTVGLDLGVSSCRYVMDVRTQRVLEHNTCVHRFHVDLKPWSGHPVIYSKTPF